MGKTWEHEIQISNSGSCAIQPDINVDAMGAHIVWMDYGSDIWKVLYKRSLDFGLTWDPEKIVFTYQNEPEPIGLWEPNILTEAKNILITVSAYPKKILSSYSLDGGETWKNEFIDQQCFYPRTNNTSRFLNKTGCGIWSDQSNDCDMKGNWEIYYARSVYGLSSWPTLIRLSSNASYSIYPTIDSNGKNAILAAWADNQSGVFKIAYRLSMDRGDSWCDASYISPESCGSWQPVAAWNRSTGNIHVIWTDYRDGDGELYHSNNSGFGWSSAARLTYSIGSVFNPDFAMDADGNSLVIWEEITDTDCQIFSQNFFQQLQN
jgi:Neuraminidase (sialidase)